MPALFTSTSHRPYSEYTASTRLSQSSHRPTWQATGMARRPVAAAISPAAASQLSNFRLAITTSAPADARPSAMARPIPRLPPVMTATLPRRSKSSSGVCIAPLLTSTPTCGETRSRPTGCPSRNAMVIWTTFCGSPKPNSQA